MSDAENRVILNVGGIRWCEQLAQGRVTSAADHRSYTYEQLA